MSFKFDSMMIILNKVDAGEKVTVPSLREELRVSERTVHRYLETLQLSGYPLFFDRRSERYAFPEGYGLKKPGLIFEEALALALAKKMVGVLGGDLGKHLDRIGQKMAARPIAEIPKIFVREDGRVKGGDYLEVLNRAALNFQRVELTYQALSSRKKTKRRVDPDYIFYQEGVWYLRGYCALREDFRTFALDQILSLKLLDDYFVPRRRPEEEELIGVLRQLFRRRGSGSGPALRSGDQGVHSAKKVASQPAGKRAFRRPAGGAVSGEWSGGDQPLDLSLAAASGSDRPAGVTGKNEGGP